MVEPVNCLPQPSPNDEPQNKLYKSALRALINAVAGIQDDLAASVAEQTSALLAAGLQSSSKMDSREFVGIDEKEAFLESSIRWLYTGRS